MTFEEQIQAAAEEHGRFLLKNFSAINPAEVYLAGAAKAREILAPDIAMLRWNCAGAEEALEAERARADRLEAQVKRAMRALRLYATYSPRQHPEGYYEIHVAPGEGGEVPFGTFAREALRELGGDGEEKNFVINNETKGSK